MAKYWVIIGIGMAAMLACEDKMPKNQKVQAQTGETLSNMGKKILEAGEPLLEPLVKNQEKEKEGKEKETKDQNGANAEGHESEPVEVPIAEPVQGKVGFVLSPYSGKIVDVKGFLPGTLVRDPYASEEEKKFFRVPEVSAWTNKKSSSKHESPKQEAPKGAGKENGTDATATAAGTENGETSPD